MTSRALKILNYALFYGWVGALLLLGGAGVFTGRWELESFMQIDLEAMSSQAQGSLLNQFRFLKATEFGFGLFCLLFRKEIFQSRRFNRIFLGVAALGALARLVAIVFDGRPHSTLVGVTAFEVLTVIVVWAYSRRTLVRA